MAGIGSSENTQCNGKISKEEQKEFKHKKLTKDPKNKEFVNRSQHAKEYSQKRKGKGHEASAAAAGGGGRDDDDDEEGGKKDKLSDLGKTDAVYCSICDNWFSDKDAYLKHVAKKLCEQIYLG